MLYLFKIQEKKNDIGLQDIAGFDVLHGISLLCHYTNHTEERHRESTAYLTDLSKKLPVIALPEEDMLFVNDDKVEIIGTRPFYYYTNAVRERREIKG